MLHTIAMDSFLSPLGNCADQDEDVNEQDQQKRMVIFSGGTAFNTVAHELQQGVTLNVAHVLPVSDDGGSTSEIVRVLGGPAVGDIRSRCLRLSDESTPESRAVKRLLGHRLVSPATAPANMTRGEIRLAARGEWLSIVEGDDDTTKLWRGISTAYKDTIRAFLVHFHVNVLRHATERFDFTGGSVGNFFFAGARMFFQSMSAAIFLYSRVSGIPSECKVLPAVITGERLTLGALLSDGTLIRGQRNISRPPESSGQTSSNHGLAGNGCYGKILPSPIERVTYLFHDKNQPMNWWDDKQQVHPDTNPQVVDSLKQAGCIIYGMGSLYTSILPTLILTGIGSHIVDNTCPKILLLNGWHDRETTWKLQDGTIKAMDATMFVQAVVNALDSSFQRHDGANSLSNTENRGMPLITDYITHILYPQGGEVEINITSLNEYCESRCKSFDGNTDEASSIQVVEVESVSADTYADSSKSGGTSQHKAFDPEALVFILRGITRESMGDYKRSQSATF